MEEILLSPIYVSPEFSAALERDAKEREAYEKAVSARTLRNCAECGRVFWSGIFHCEFCDNCDL